MLSPAPMHVWSPVSPSQVVNLQYSEVQDRVMLTGRHMVRDVSCKNCNSKLGWIYEFATEDSQRYKEGRVILERALVRESEGFEEHVPSDNSWTPGLDEISPFIPLPLHCTPPPTDFVISEVLAWPHQTPSPSLTRCLCWKKDCFADYVMAGGKKSYQVSQGRTPKTAGDTRMKL